MSNKVLIIEDLSKRYRLGTISSRMLTKDFTSFLSHRFGREDPNSIVTASNDLHSINSIKCFCLDNNIPLLVIEGSPTIATKDDWARDMRHFGKQTHSNIANDIISKLQLYIDK